MESINAIKTVTTTTTGEELEDIITSSSEKTKKEFVQILHQGGNHWITVSTVGVEHPRVRVYDSRRGVLQDRDKKAIMQTDEKELIIEYANNQVNNNVIICENNIDAGIIYASHYRNNRMTMIVAYLLLPLPWQSAMINSQKSSSSTQKSCVVKLQIQDMNRTFSVLLRQHTRCIHCSRMERKRIAQ